MSYNYWTEYCKPQHNGKVDITMSLKMKSWTTNMGVKYHQLHFLPIHMWTTIRLYASIYCKIRYSWKFLPCVTALQRKARKWEASCNKELTTVEKVFIQEFQTEVGFACKASPSSSSITFGSLHRWCCSRKEWYKHISHIWIRSQWKFPELPIW